MSDRFQRKAIMICKVCKKMKEYALSFKLIYPSRCCECGEQ
jgi:hypothetical protein